MKKYRIGLIGSENTHAGAFAKAFYEEADFCDMIVTAIYGDEERENSEKIQVLFPGAVIVDRVEDMLGLVDGVMITSRDGKHHFPYAKPFLDAGIPLFVDKPFTVDPAEALALVALAKERNTPLCGGSSLKCCPDVVQLAQLRNELGEKLVTGYVSAPLVPDSPYSGFFFYASHMVEMCLTVFGWRPEAVTAVQKKGRINTLFHYPDADVVCAHTTGCGRYFIEVAGCPNILEAKDIDLTPAYRLEAEEFVQMMRTGNMPYSYEQLTEPVFCMNAIKESYETGKTVAICRI